MKRFSPEKFRGSLIEPLEARIAPATVVPYAILPQKIPASDFVTVAAGSALLMHPGQILTTGTGGGGTYLLWDQAGEMLVFTTDLNGNGKIDPNEITGISAGNGLKMTAFCDINGDIVTNLNPDATLTNSHPGAAVDPILKGDGGILLDSKILGITLRSLTAADTPDYLLHLSLSSYSIHGSVYAGGGFGDGQATDGLIIDTSGFGDQSSVFGGLGGANSYFASTPTPDIGNIIVGTAASGLHFYLTKGVQGTLAPFVAPVGEAGGSIIGVKASDTGMHFNLGLLQAGNGGFGAAGGNVTDVQISGALSGGYEVIAGNGGAGATGGAGGSILSFSDFGTVASVLFIKAGDGGKGLSGAGGSGGTVTFGTMTVSANLLVQMGNGGDGFGNGGNGGSLPVATITVPDTGGQNSSGVDLVSSTRNIGDIGTTQMIDFNGDGIGDAVWTTQNPDQVIVGFGNGNGGFTNLEFLNVPDHISKVVVGDFNGDGLPDIAVVSDDPSSFAGITVFLNKGVPSKTNPDNVFVDSHGFAESIQTPIPSLNLAVLGAPNQPPVYFNSAVPVNAIAVGDFNGDGKMDVAIDVTEQMINGTLPPTPHEVTIMLEGDGSGHFYGAFGTINAPVQPYVDLGKTSDLKTVLLQATALTKGNTQDVVIEGNVGGKSLNVISYPLDPTALGVIVPGPTVLNLSLGKVDTDRKLPDTNPEIALVQATTLGFAITDIDSGLASDGPTGYADIVVLTKDPSNFLVTFEGDSTGTFGGTAASGGTPAVAGAPASAPQADGQQNGIFVGDPDTGGLINNASLVAIVADDPTHTGVINGVALLDYTADQTKLRVDELDFKGQFTQGTLPPPSDKSSPPALSQFQFTNPVHQDSTIVGFDFYNTGLTFAGKALDGDGIFSPVTNTTDALFQTVQFGGAAFGPTTSGFFSPIGASNSNIVITAGNGGESVTGSGGNGGIIGTVGKLASTVSLTGVISIAGAINIHEPATKIAQANTIFTSGTGGDGFINGGSGGSISSIEEDFAGTFQVSNILLVGNGGNGISGTGGAGGSISSNSIQSAVEWVAGNGGSGYTGGKGGSVVGNGIAGVNDTVTGEFIIFSGSGGHGISTGGSGGNISGIKALFQVVGRAGGTIDYEAGSGGGSVSGTGGAGGSITNDSPLATEDDIDGEIRLVAGDGGNGATGGAGGSISSFINSATLSNRPQNIFAVAGDGGGGIAGVGGAGGSITNLSVDVLGKFGTLNQLPFSSVLAGNGGNSSGSIGGVGGSLTNVTSISESASASAAAAGAGGFGLTKGGIGGSVTNTVVNASAQVQSPQGENKVLIVAGDGGAGLAFLNYEPPAKSTDVYHVMQAFGGVNSTGGNGGSVVNFQQPTSVQVDVDLIAGNGGSTPNYGSPSDTNKSGVGSGGSISGLSLAIPNIAGNIGNPDPTVAIKAYNDTTGPTGTPDGIIEPGETMAAFVAAYLRNGVPNSVDLSGFTPLTDALGNVGIQVGAAGRVKDDLPASGVLNGNLTDIHARNIVSAVAGSVDAVEAIHTISDVSVYIAAGVLGAHKDVDQFASGQPSFNSAAGANDANNPYSANESNYFAVIPSVANPNGILSTSPELDGILIDGAIVAQNVGTLTGIRVFTE